MRVALVSKADAKGGGAGRVADDIYHGLTQIDGYSAKRFVGHWSPSLDPKVFGPISSKHHRLRSHLRHLATAAGYIDHYPIELIGLNPEIRAADLVHFHDLSSVFAPRGLLRIGRRRPVIWTLHDLSALTGGCIYPLGCRRYLQGCGSCPQIGEWPLLTRSDRTSEMERERRRVLAAGRIHLVAPSEWMRRQVQAKHPDAIVHVILNGVDTDVFVPSQNRLRFVGVGRDSPSLSVLFVANYSAEVRKGSLYIPEIIDWLRSSNRTLRLVIAGNAPRKGVHQLGPLELLYLGHIASKARLAKLYSSVDAVLSLSHADNCPLVVLEALSCGAPVFAFGTGGVPELVDEGSGRVCPPGALSELLEQLFACWEGGLLHAMRQSARARAEVRFGLRRFIEEHVSLYEQIVASNVG